MILFLVDAGFLPGVCHSFHYLPHPVRYLRSCSLIQVWIKAQDYEEKEYVEQEERRSPHRIHWNAHTGAEQENRQRTRVPREVARKPGECGAAGLEGRHCWQSRGYLPWALSISVLAGYSKNARSEFSFLGPFLGLGPAESSLLKDKANFFLPHQQSIVAPGSF